MTEREGTPRIIVPGLPGQQPVDASIIIPGGNALIIPEGIRDPRVQTGITVATDAELVALTDMPSEKPTRTSSEFALALHNPFFFVSREVEKRLSAKRPPGISEVTQNFRTIGKTDRKSDSETADIRDFVDSDFDDQAFVRSKRSVSFTHTANGSRETRDISVPGALETFGLAAVSLLDDPEIAPEAEYIVLRPLGKLLQKYRIHTGRRQEVPEMPDLTQVLVDKIDQFDTNRRVRNGIYNVLEQITLPTGLQEELMTKMDQQKDLDHPLAFKTTVSLADKEKSPWIDIQQERRDSLVHDLQGSNQMLFDNFDDLLTKSRGLVVSFDPKYIPSGKVGLEVEANLKPESLTLRGQHENIIAVLGRSLGLDSKGWILGLDARAFEIRKADNYLEYGRSYVNDFIHLKQWLGDHGTFLKSLHLHFDRQRHPEIPEIGHLYEGDSNGKKTLEMNELGTWEVRGLNLPRSEHSLHPARLADMVGLYLSATDIKPSRQSKRLHLEEDQELSLKQITFGHIATFISAPEGRLAALMALHDNKALLSVNPLAFAHSFEFADLEKLAVELRGEFMSDEDGFYLDALEGFATNTIPDRVTSELDDDDILESYLDIMGRVFATSDMHGYYKRLDKARDVFIIQAGREIIARANAETRRLHSRAQETDEAAE